MKENESIQFWVYYEWVDGSPHRKRFATDGAYPSEQKAQERVRELEAQRDVNWATYRTSYNSVRAAHFLWASR